jgi:hypothetical protein
MGSRDVGIIGSGRPVMAKAKRKTEPQWDAYLPTGIIERRLRLPAMAEAKLQYAATTMGVSESELIAHVLNLMIPIDLPAIPDPRKRTFTLPEKKKRAGGSAA